jgi:hypothetical protein
MANSKISALTSATTPLAGTEVLPIVQSGATVKASVANIQAASVSAGTANAVQYLNGSKVPTTSTALSFDGNILGLGGTPSPWATLTNTIDLSNGASLFGYNNNAYLNANMYFNGGYKYKATAASARYEISNGQHFWFTAGSGSAGTAITFVQRMQLENGDGTLTLNTGNLVQGTAAKGINFTANTPAAGMTSQLLNWYEEGTWVPALKFGATGSTGTYTRIGRQVTVRGGLTGTSISFGASSIISDNLPFTSASEFTGVVAASDSTNGALMRVLGIYCISVTAIPTPVTSISFSTTYFI